MFFNVTCSHQKSVCVQCIMKTIKKLLPLILIVSFALIIYLVFSTPPKANKRGHKVPPALVVEVIDITPQTYQVMLSSFGKIRPTTQSQLSAQVSGQITHVNESFKAGRFFKKGDVLVTLDDRDYTIGVQSASAERAQAKVALDEEKALSAQAIKDRKNLGTLGQASDYALRKPQMAAATAKLQAADANLKQALLDVERTQIKAPYDGRILTKQVSLGQVVGSSTVLADIYAIDSAQVELPIKNAQLNLINLPNNHVAANQQNASNVIVFNHDGGVTQSWPAHLARTSAGVNDKTQQVSIISEIAQPFAQVDKRSLNIGQFVTASITGKLMANAIVIPNAAIYQGSYVYLYNDGKLQRSQVDIAYQNENDAVIISGVSDGNKLVITPLGQVSSGTPVKLLGASDKKQRRKAKGNKRHQKASTQEQQQ